MDWTRGHALGRGSTAAVYIAESHRSGEVFAVKTAELHRSEELQKEQGLLSTLNCPQIVTYQGYDVTFENGAHWYNLFMEYAPRGTLVDLVSNHNGAMEESLVGFYTRQILLGLNYLQSNGIVHCDVKGQNVLVTDQGAKIADLGCARRVGSGGVIAGTPVFMAPEVARGEQQGFPADVWALGCTVLEMITGKPPWHGVANDPVSMLYRVGFSGEAPEVPGFVSEQGKDFLGKCLRRDPSERWTVGELLGHGFVAESRLEGKEIAFGIGRCDWDTPPSVLERGFWDSLETSQDSTRGWCSWDSPSAGDRVRRLCGTGEPAWEWGDDDEKWITVRSNEVSEGELLWVHDGEGSIVESEDCGSDNVGILREENGLVIFYEPKAVVGNVIQLSRWTVAVNDCYLCSTNCGCCSRDSLFLGRSCLKFFTYGNFDPQKKEIFVKLDFLLSLFPSLIPLWMN